MGKSKYNYLSEWFNAVPARWYGMITILVVIVAGVVAGIIWLAQRGLEWWWIALGAAVVFVFILFSFFAYHKAAVERDKLADEKAGIIKERNEFADKLLSTKNELERLQRMPPTQIAVSHQFIPDNYISGRIIHLMDLLAPGAKPIITNRTIEDCEIRGPAMVVLLGRVTIANDIFDGDIDSLFVEIADERWIFGAIGLQDCVFRRCRFTAIGIIGTKEQIKEAKQGFKPLTSGKEGSQP
jgi:energy-coupling factor transporter transmembrane protein EcfT